MAMKINTHVNVSKVERIASILAGSYFMYRTFKRHPKNLAAIASAGLLMYRGVTGHCPAYEATGKTSLIDSTSNIEIETSIIVNRPVDTVYSFWRRLENLPLFMTHLKSVNQKEDGKSDWEAKIPGGLGTIHWEAIVTSEIPSELIAWQSLEDATIQNGGYVTFDDLGDLGTCVNVKIHYRAPMGMAGEKVISLFNPTFEKMIRRDIMNFKHYVETGAIPVEKQYKNSIRQDV
jgi:uncharacterized membrane protein